MEIIDQTLPSPGDGLQAPCNAGPVAASRYGFHVFAEACRRLLVMAWAPPALR